MGYCILRFAKLKSRVSLLRAAKHNTRERMPSNANPAWTKINVTSASTEDVMAAYTAKLPPKVRKNAVHAVEAVVTLSPGSWEGISAKERFAQSQKYLVDAMHWVYKTMGGQQNLISASVHFDEATPHAHVIMMPLRDGKLNAKSYIGGHRDRLKELQDDFYEKVGKKHNLERGRPREKTKSRHMTQARYHAVVDKAIKAELEREAALREREHRRRDGLGR